MADGLPVVSTREAVQAFRKLGFEVLPGRGKGSHVVMFSPSHPAILTIPERKDIAAGTLRGLIRKAGVTVDEFRKALT